MKASIQLYLLGNDCQSPESLKNLTNVKCRTLENIRLESLQLRELVSLFEESPSEFVGLIDEPVFLHPEQLTQINDLDLISDQTGIYFLPFSHSEQFIHSFNVLPPLAAILAMNPLQHSVVLVQKSAFFNLKDLSDSTDLLWHSLILMTQAGIKNQLTEPITLSHRGKLQINLPQLTPTYPNSEGEWLLRLLQDYEPVQDLPAILSPPDATALKAGLFCIHDYLDESHVFSQSVQNEGLNRAGDYWHHIMHRREPDYSNAKYWSRAVGYHPLQDVLPKVVRPLFDQFQSPNVTRWKKKLLASERWSLNTFVDFCAECESTNDSQLNELARNIQWIEMQLLLQKTSLDAVTS